MPTYSELAGLLRENKPAAMATLVSGDNAGTKILLSADGYIEGSIDPGVDDAVITDMRTLLVAAKNELKSYEVGGQSFEIFIETFPPPQRLIIIGGVHVAIPLHKIAKLLGYHITVIDARGTLATQDRFPQADEILVEWPDEAMAHLGLDSGTSVVVLAHDPKFDYPSLFAAVQSKARYVGAIGSKTTNDNRKEALKEMGATEEQIGRIHAPVGLDIGGKSPAEIALAVMSEIVAERYGRGGGMLSRK